MNEPQSSLVEVGPAAGAVTAILHDPPNADWLYVFAPGAGAGIDHWFMVQMAEALAAHRVASLRYQFPYGEAGRRRVDSQGLLIQTVRAVLTWVHGRFPRRPTVVGGKSMGGRMTSLAAAEAPLVQGSGVVFLGFPLHPAGRPATGRAAHLDRVPLPMCFIQGTRDRLCDLDLLRQVLPAGSLLHPIDQADHGFAVPKRSGRGQADVLDEIAATVRRFVDRLGGA